MLGRGRFSAIAVVVAGAVLVASCGEGEPAGPEAGSSVEQVGEQTGKEDGARQSSEQKIRGPDGSTVQQSEQGNQSNQVNQSGSGSSISQSQSSSGGGGGVQTFSGTGRSEVTTLTVNGPSRLAWTNNEGRPFTLKDGASKISVDSTRGRGEVSLEGGTYRDIKVSGDVWTVVVRPR
jgi:hypothetical protein